MIEKTGDGTLRITLSPACTITEVEAHADKLRSQSRGVERVELNAAALEEIDTAYLQLLLSLKATLEEMDVPFSLSGLGRVMDEALKLYGLMNGER